MSASLNSSFKLLIKAVSEIDNVMSIGKSGSAELPQANESDIDIFIFCHSTPSKEERKSAVNSLGDLVSNSKFSDTESRHWGTVDFTIIDDTEICLMYFEIDKMNMEIESIISGTRLSREDNYYYPTGRCACILSMHILFDKARYIKMLKDKLADYPMELSKKLVNYHIIEINDFEDFERAVSRDDVLFFHATLDNAIDHYLQALFALNKVYFPSRKRTIQLVEQFQVKPIDFSCRLLKTITLGANPQTLAQSYSEWSSLCEELKNQASGIE
jgi:hypothetical protein